MHSFIYLPSAFLPPLFFFFWFVFLKMILLFYSLYRYLDSAGVLTAQFGSRESNADNKETQNVIVAVRVRPFNDRFVLVFVCVFVCLRVCE